MTTTAESALDRPALSEPVKHRLLIVDDEEGNLDLLASALRRGNIIFKAQSGEEALRILEKDEIHLVITDQRMPGISGTDLLAMMQAKNPNIGRILVTGFTDLDVVIEAINKGKVHRFISKPWDPKDVKQLVSEELERYDLVTGNERLTRDLIAKNTELEVVNQELAQQKEEFKKLAQQYRQQRELAIEMSEKFARANLDLIKAQEENRQNYLKLERANKQLGQLSVTDGLTSFFNHRHMNELLEGEIGRARRYNLFLSVMMIDLDRFKTINDTHGHLFGDTVLRMAAELIRHNIRETDYPTRYGGDEFLIILPHTGIDRATFLAKRIQADLRNHLFHAPNGDKIRQTVSIGIAYFPHQKAKGREDLISLVDEALYEAKESGRDRIVITAP